MNETPLRGNDPFTAASVIAWVDRNVWTRRTPTGVGAQQRRACIDVLSFGLGRSLHQAPLTPQDAQRIAALYRRTGAAAAHDRTADLFLETYRLARADRRVEVARTPMVPTGAEVVRAVEEAYLLGEIPASRRNRALSGVRRVLPLAFGLQWRQSDIEGAVIEAALERHIADPRRRAEWRSDIRLALKLLDERMTLAPRAKLPDLRAVAEIDEELPTGAGLMSHIIGQARAGLIDDRTAASRRYAVRLVLRQALGEHWESHSLVDFDLNKAVADINLPGMHKRVSVLRVALREYDVTHPGRLGHLADQAYEKQTRQYTDDFRPSGSGLLNFVHHKLKTGKLSTKQAVVAKEAVKWILSRSLGEGWELKDLRSVDLTAMVESCRYTAATRPRYPSAFRATVTAYNEEHGDALPALPSRFQLRQPVQSSLSL